jgi:hypothetical protein
MARAGTPKIGNKTRKSALPVLGVIPMGHASKFLYKKKY